MGQGLSAAQKYAELEANGLERPCCACHQEPMIWNKMGAEGRWRCYEKSRRSHHRYVSANRKKLAEKSRLYRESNPEDPEKKAAANAARVFVDGMYLGSFRFTKTEVEAMLSGTSN